ncbi:MAG: 50S ribosomal protein L25 [Firmicutes bacterium]|nr:50S ribosomal protein L25 [Bacillota bacterium]
MEQVEISAVLRGSGKGVARRLRAQGKLPAVIYGKSTESTPLVFDRKTFEKAARGDRNVLLKVRIEGPGGVVTKNAMIQEIQEDPVKYTPLHVDLREVNLEEKIKLRVSIHLVGEEELQAKGAILQHQMREVEVECLPAAVPDRITVHVGDLNPGDHVTAGDLKIPENVKLLEEPDELVISVLAPRAEEEVEAPEAAPEGAEPEVIKKGKDEEAKEE